MEVASMKTWVSFYIFACIVLSTVQVFSSEIDFLGWQSVTIGLKTPGENKDVKVIASQNRQFEFDKFLIKIDGTEYKLNEDQLKLLNGYPLSSISLTYEVGNEKVGGDTIGIRLTKRFYQKDTLINNIVRISINKRGLSITESKRN